mgnify:CR=1 FL=1
MISVHSDLDSLKIKSIQEKLAKTTDDKFFKWKFIYLDSLEITKLYQSLKTLPQSGHFELELLHM